MSQYLLSALCEMVSNRRMRVSMFAAACLGCGSADVHNPALQKSTQQNGINPKPKGIRAISLGTLEVQDCQ